MSGVTANSHAVGTEWFRWFLSVFSYFFVEQTDRLMETSEVDTSILSSLHGNRYEPFGDSAFLVEEGLDKDLPQTLPELSDITDSDTYLHDNDASQMMTVDNPW